MLHLMKGLVIRASKAFNPSKQKEGWCSKTAFLMKILLGTIYRKIRWKWSLLVIYYSALSPWRILQMNSSIHSPLHAALTVLMAQPTQSSHNQYNLDSKVPPIHMVIKNTLMISNKYRLKRNSVILNMPCVHPFLAYKA